METVLELRNVARAFAQGGIKLDIFKQVNLAVRPGEIVALVGQSGAGKSSLLHIAGLLEAPTAGEVFIAGRNCSALDDLSRTRIRRLGIGFVYQFHHLLPEFSALENVILPQLIAGAASEPPRCRSGSASFRGALTARRTCPAASSSGWRSPVRWPTGRSCCWPTSRPAISIRGRRATSMPNFSG